MSGWDLLPQELLQLVFEFVNQTPSPATVFFRCHSRRFDNKKDMLQCQLTCKNWCWPAKRVRYTSIILSDIKTASFFFKSLVDMSCGNNDGQLVKTIDIKKAITTSYRYDWISFDSLPSILATYCPNLCEVRVSITVQSFWEQLTRVRKNGGLQSISKIPYPCSEGAVGWYVDAAIACRSSLEDLLICDHVGRGITPTSHLRVTKYLDRMNQHLERFTKLKRLEIREHARKKLFEYDQMLNRCRTSLNEICIITSPLVEWKTMNSNTRYSNSISIISNNDKTLQNMSSPIRPLHNISKLELDVLVNSVDILLYLIQKFPCLDSLTCNVYPDRFSMSAMAQSKFSIPKVVRLEFARFLKCIKSFQFYNICTRDSVELVDTLLDEKNMNVLFRSIHVELPHYNNSMTAAERREYDDLSIIHLEKGRTNYPNVAKDVVVCTVQSPILIADQIYALTHFVLLERLAGKMRSLWIDFDIKRCKENDTHATIASVSRLERQTMHSALYQNMFPCLKRLVLQNLSLCDDDGGNIFKPIMERDYTSTATAAVLELELLDCKVTPRDFRDITSNMPSLKSIHVVCSKPLTVDGSKICSDHDGIIDLSRSNSASLDTFYFTSLSLASSCHSIREEEGYASVFWLHIITDYEEVYYKCTSSSRKSRDGNQGGSSNQDEIICRKNTTELTIEDALKRRDLFLHIKSKKRIENIYIADLNFKGKCVFKN